MEELVKADLPFIRKDMSRQEAIAFFREKGEPYKVEIIQDMDDDVCDVSLYEQGSFVDLCRGPHVPSTGYIKAFKLLSIAGAYWRGDEKNQMLQRIYGTAFSSPKELKTTWTFWKRPKSDHRKLGRELDLFMFSDDAGLGLVIYMPKGGRLRSLIEEFEKSSISAGLRHRLWPEHPQGQALGNLRHMDNYKENMYFTELDTASSTASSP